jgi:hypothetical protein
MLLYWLPQNWQRRMLLCWLRQRLPRVTTLAPLDSSPELLLALHRR